MASPHVDLPSGSAEAATRQELRPWLARFGEIPDGNGRGPGLELLVGRDSGSPLRAHGGGCTAIFDGVLHNREDVRAMLSGSGSALESDAEMVLRAYIRWGAAALDRLRGIFALAVWDVNQRSLLCARDPLGVYPLFHVTAGSDLFLSTAIDTLLSAEQVPAELNRAAIADHLRRRWPDPEETYFAAVKRLPAGHALVVDSAGRRSYRYWDPAPPDREIDWIDERELERFDELLGSAVNRCLALGPAAIFLSGGLDSVTVAALAADSARACGLPDPQALSLVFPHHECNEEAVQRGVAGELGVPQLLLGFEEAAGGQGPLLAALELSSRGAAPLMNYWAPAYERLALEGRRRGFKTILTGAGGDEWLTVTPFLAADLLRSGGFKDLWRLAASYRRSFQISTAGAWRYVLWSFGGKVLLRAALDSRAPWALKAYRRRATRSAWPDWVAPEKGLRTELKERTVGGRGRPVGGSYYRQEGSMSLDHPLIAMELEETFESGRRSGVRILAPFLDADLIDFLYRTPPDLLNLGGRAKGLVRESAARRFPKLGFMEHKKVSATSYGRSMLTRQARQAWDALGGVPCLAELGVVDPAGFGVYLDRAVSGHDRAHWRIWDVFSLEAWVRPHLERKGGATAYDRH